MPNINEMNLSELMSEETVRRVCFIVLPNGDEVIASASSMMRDIVPYRERAKELKGTFLFDKWWNDILKTKQKETKLVDKGLRREQDVQIVANGETFVRNLVDYRYDDSGVWRPTPRGVFNETVVTRRLIFHTNIFTNIEDDSTKVEVCFKDLNGRWVFKIFPREMLTKASTIQELARYGMDVTSENARDVVEYLAVTENANLENIARGISISRFGWFEKDDEMEFSPYCPEVTFDATDRFPAIARALRSEGSFGEWLELVKKVRRSGRTEPLIYLVASFASALVEPLGILPFIVNLWTETGRGKTVAMMVACSVWANPDEGQYMTDSTATTNALEARLGVLHSLPMMIDDLSKLKEQDEKEFARFVYYVCAGKGKDRSNLRHGINDANTWKNCILTNMERPLATDTMKGGAINRILDFKSEEGSYFADGKRDRGNEVVDIVKHNYGHAGRIFVDAIKGMEVDELRDKFKKYQAEIKSLADTPKEEKQIAPLACLFLADELIENFIFDDGVRLDKEWCVDQLKSIEQVSENKRAYEMLITEVVANLKTHFDTIAVLEGKDHNTYALNERWGIVNYKRGYVYIFTTAYKAMAKKYDFSADALSDWAYKNGLSERDKKTRQKNVMDTVSRAAIRAYSFKFETGNDEFIDVSEIEEDAPFT